MIFDLPFKETARPNVTMVRLGNNKALVRVDQASRVVDVSDLPQGRQVANLDDVLLAKFNDAGPNKPPPDPTPPHVKSRREKMIEIGQQSVASRKRPFSKFPHLTAGDKNQAYDGLLAALMRGKIQLTDTIPVRHLKSGEFEDMKVADLLDEVADMFLLRIQLRHRDRHYRDQVNVIFKDTAKTEEEKSAAIDALELPEFLDVDEASTAEQLVSRRANGKAGGKTG
jgi:hypothetical protein